MLNPPVPPSSATSSRRAPRGAIVLLGAALVLALGLPARPAGEGLLDPLPNRLSEATRWLRGYLRIDTSNPGGSETVAARYLEGILRAEGIETELVELEPGRGNLVARIRGSGARPPLVLNHHVDVVPPGNGRWKFPPFAAAVRDGRLYGRGVIDDKGRGMSQVAALVALRRSGVPLDRDVVLLATADEETGGRLGVRGLLERRPELVRGAVGVLGEGGVNDVVIDKVQLWKIEISQKRPLWLRIEARGEAGHGAVPSPGAASHRLLKALGKILAWSPEPAASDLVADCLRQWAPAKVGRKQEILRDIRRALRENPREIGVFFGTSMQALFAPTIAIGRFEGSSSVNVLPAVAWAEVDLRIRPEDDAEAIVASLRDLVKEDRVEISVLESSPPVSASPVSGELYRALAEFLPGDEPGSVVAPSISPGFTDGRFFRQAGIPTYGFSPLKINYYDMSGIHGTDEKIRIDFFDESVARMSRFLERFCGTAASAAR